MLKMLARRKGVSVTAYTRKTLHDHIIEQGAVFLQKGAVFRQQFIRDVKEYVLLYREPVVTKEPMKEEKDSGAPSPKLPGQEKRQQLEAKMWEAFNTAYKWFQTEDASANATARLRVLEVLANVARTERAILADMDKAVVDDLVERVEVELNGLASEGSAKPARP